MYFISMNIAKERIKAVGLQIMIILIKCEAVL
jgi:hypothetical protein